MVSSKEFKKVKNESKANISNKYGKSKYDNDSSSGAWCAFS